MGLLNRKTEFILSTQISLLRFLWVAGDSIAEERFDVFDFVEYSEPLFSSKEGSHRKQGSVEIVP